MPSALLDQPTDFGDHWSMVEWAERTIFLEKLDSLTRTEILRRFGSDQPDAADLDKLVDEVRRRAEMPGRCYPLQISEAGAIARNESIDPRVYEFLELLSYIPAPYREARQFNTVNPAFDLLVREAFRDRLGGPAEAVRFGTPVRDGRPQDFREAIEWIAQRMGREVNDLSDVRGSDNDGGVDVIAWRPFASGGTISSPSFAQTTVQAKFAPKAGDVNPQKWLGWIKLGTPPRSALVVPFIVAPDDDVVRDVSFHANDFLARLELCEHLDVGELTAFEPEWSFMRDWTDGERDKLKTMLSAGGDPAAQGKPRK